MTPDFHLTYSKNKGNLGSESNWLKSEKFRYFSIKSYVVDVYYNRLTEAILIHIQNIWFYGELTIIKVKTLVFVKTVWVRRRSRNDVAWESRGTAIDPCVRHIFSWRFGHENISTASLPLPLIQEEHLSVNGERMGAKYWQPASGRLA